LDDMIPLKMDVLAASRIVALRPCIEAFVVRSCLRPEAAHAMSEQDRKLVEILKEISSPEGWSPEKPSVPPADQRILPPIEDCPELSSEQPAYREAQGVVIEEACGAQEALLIEGSRLAGTGIHLEETEAVQGTEEGEEHQRQAGVHSHLKLLHKPTMGGESNIATGEFPPNPQGI
uniref:Caspase recruitment domain-containing protein 14 n=1 Tax=Toxocara canis TaxID=6265 RepID=A0A183U315_TOXCA